MMGATHLIIGLFTGVLFHVFFQLPILSIPFVLVGALLPDVDHERSMINKFIPVTRIIPSFFSHRGFFHSIFPVLIILVLSVYFDFWFVGFPVALGYLSHLLSDSLTFAGCNFLYPFSRFQIRGFISTGGVYEFFISLVALVAIFVLILRVF